ncbi:alpha/beta hydrolase [Thermodesulfobacteriota bacterium]
MIDVTKIDFSQLDRPEILMFLFHPRPDFQSAPAGGSSLDLSIPVEGGNSVGARFHIGGNPAPNILFFHGNGEIVSDYDDLGSFYKRMGLNFLPVDYRGYGRSTGNPTITAMMRDCHFIFEFTKDWLHKNGYSGPLILMGRSLGSASALELAFHYKDEVAGLIIESGFAYAGPLLELLGIDLKTIGFNEDKGFNNKDKIRDFDKPVLIIHAELDHIIPFTDGQALFGACNSPDKTMLGIPGANHNDIFVRGLSEYMEAVKELAEKVKA